MQFTSAYQIPFAFSPYAREHLKVGSVAKSFNGVILTDLDDYQFYDLTGSYGVNLFGSDFYKRTMQKGLEDGVSLGPALGVYHPHVASNASRLCKISGMDEELLDEAYEGVQSFIEREIETDDEDDEVPLKYETNEQSMSNKALLEEE